MSSGDRLSDPIKPRHQSKTLAFSLSGKILYMAAFYQGMRRLLRQNQSSGILNHNNLEILLIIVMDNLIVIVSICM